MVATEGNGDNESSPVVSEGGGVASSGVQEEPATLEAALKICFQALESAQLFYGHGTDNAWDEAVQLVLGALGLPPDGGEELLERTVDVEEWRRISELLQQRIDTRHPLPYLLGRAWFAGVEFRCDSRALVPRSPLAEVILHDYAPWIGDGVPQRILDLCCGGGCIGIAAALHQPLSTVLLADIDEQALSLARENIDLHDLAARVSTRKSNLFADLAPEAFDLILCNPPYVDDDDIQAMPQEFATEPAHALASGRDGLNHAFSILEHAPAWLREEGLLFLELGNSWEALEHICADVAFTWLEFEHGGHGVLVADRALLLENHALFAERAATRFRESV